MAVGKKVSGGRVLAGVLIGVVVLVAALLRFDGLGDYWLNPDEGTYYSVLSWPTFAERQLEISEGAHPPFFYHLLWAWSRVSTSLVWLRALAATAGTLSVIAIWLLARELFPGPRGEVAGLLSAFFLALSPAAVAQSQLLRPYTFQILLLVLSLYGLARWRRRGGGAGLVIYSLAMAVALLTHYGSVFVLAAIGVTLAAFVVRAFLVRSKPPRSTVLALAVAQLPPFVALLVIYFGHVRLIAGTAWQDTLFQTWLAPYLGDDPLQLWRRALGFAGYLLGDSLSGVVALAFLGSLALAVKLRARTLWLVSGAAFGFAAIASWIGSYPFGPIRHSLALAPILIVPIAWAIATGLTAARRWQAVTVVALLALILTRQPIYAALSGGRRLVDLGPEQVLRTADLERMRPLLDSLQASEGLLVTNGHTVLGPEMQAGVRAGRIVDGIRCFPWGRRTVLVLTVSAFSVDPADLGTGLHLADFLQHADRTFPELGVASQSRLRFLLADFNNLPLFRLLELDRRRGAADPWIVGLSGVPGLALLELDAKRFLAETRRP